MLLRSLLVNVKPFRVELAPPSPMMFVCML